VAPVYNGKHDRYNESMNIPKDLISTPASDEAIKSVSKKLGLTIPIDLINLYKTTNGFEGPIGEKGYLAVYPIEELVDTNLKRWKYLCDVYPTIFIFGSDGGGSIYGYDTAPGKGLFVTIDPITEDIYDGGKTIDEFFENVDKYSFVLRKEDSQK